MKRYALILLVALAVCFGAYQFAQATGEPPNGKPTSVITQALYGPTAIITSTVYSAPSTVLGKNPQLVRDWNEADIFVVGTVGSGASFVATVQFSNDNTNWGDGYFWATKSDGTVVSNAYAKTVSTSGTTYIRVPITGEYIRVKLAATGAVTPTILMTLRNN